LEISLHGMSSKDLETQAKFKRTPKASNEAEVRSLLDRVFAEDLHAKRVLSLTHATLGVLHAASLGIHAIGQGLAAARGMDPKHTIKQVNRMLSNAGIDVWALFEYWVPFLVNERKEIVAALDWTEFDADDHATIALHLLTNHGRATPLLWKTVKKSELKDRRNDYEDELLVRLREVLPPDVEVLILADRGFADQKLFKFMKDLEFHYLIRIRGNVYVTNTKGERKRASEWVSPSGRPVALRNAKVTADECPVETVVCVHDTEMKEAWCLATDQAMTGAMAVKRYGKRFTIEESFRDIKDERFGLGLGATHIGDAGRRDRLILIAAMAVFLLTLLGAAGESLGFDRHLKANTVKRRTHSLLKQGMFWYSALPNMRDERFEPLMTRFGELVAQQQLFKEIFGLI
jgi:hypothetical protein